jgi:hypothetical protein
VQIAFSEAEKTNAPEAISIVHERSVRFHGFQRRFKSADMSDQIRKGILFVYEVYRIQTNACSKRSVAQENNPL